ncbi:hypothetical protein [Desulfatibacillum aliphaticivorans]|uniref:Lipoprotein n=1 Tax=Desulfatibacillum aliphaticivorans TaxID=218208 RepID=B8FIB3_DESAL|nr:hypothetical protein [Desulfatibacillum aliphaticivorans]ACL02680.1 hypothetical protein Dalk_0977 [Desulfatibacillum aliphaticivorans]
MNVPARFLCSIIAVSLLFLPACTKTKVASTWKKENLQRGPIERVLVVGMCTDPDTRELFESVFALEVLKHKVGAITGYETFPSNTCPTPEAIKEKCKSLNVDSVLLVRAISQEEAPVYQPPPTFETAFEPMPFDGYLTKSSAMGIQTGSYKRQMLIRLQTRVFDVATEKQIWSAKTNTINPKSTYGLVEELSEKIIAALKKDGLIAK